MNPLYTPLARLSEIAVSITDGDHQAPPKAASGVPFLTIAAINNSYLAIDRATRYVPEAYFSALKPDRKPQIGDVLFSVTGSIAIPAIVDDPRPFTFQRHIAIIRPDPKLVDTRFLWYALQTTDIKEQARAVATGTAQPTIPLSGLRNFKLPLPPLSEQRRIVAKIDSLTGKSRRARDHLDHIPRLVEKYKQAVLAAAFDEANGSLGHLVTIGEIASEVRNGLSKKPTDGPEGTPILRISAVRPRQVRLDDVRYYPTEEVPASAMLRAGDLLFTRYNGNPEFTAVCGQVRHVAGELTYPDKLIRVRMTQGVEPSFVELMATSEQARRWLDPHIKSAAGQHGISGADLKRLPIPLPSLATQQSIVIRIEATFVWIDRLASEATSARRLIDRLDQAVLAKAFRGELVPQDAEDEPASVLLDRIRAERDTTTKTRRGRRPAA